MQFIFEGSSGRERWHCIRRLGSFPLLHQSRTVLASSPACVHVRGQGRTAGDTCAAVHLTWPCPAPVSCAAHRHSLVLYLTQNVPPSIRAAFPCTSPVPRTSKPCYRCNSPSCLSRVSRLALFWHGRRNLPSPECLFHFLYFLLLLSLPHRGPSVPLYPSG